MLTQITYNLAYEMASGGRTELEAFYKHGEWRHYIWWTHYNFLYVHENNGTGFHRLNTQCFVCGAIPDRNFAGIGTLMLVKSPRPDRMRLICPDCVLCNGMLKDFKALPAGEQLALW